MLGTPGWCTQSDCHQGGQRSDWLFLFQIQSGQVLPPDFPTISAHSSCLMVPRGLDPRGCQLLSSRVLISCGLHTYPYRLIGWLHGCAFTQGPACGRAQCLVPCSAVAILKFLLTFEEEACHVPFDLGPINYGMGPCLPLWCSFYVLWSGYCGKRILCGKSI